MSQETYPPSFCFLLPSRYSFGFRISDFGFLLLIALVVFPHSTFAAAPWWNNDWKHRAAVTAPREARHSMLFELDAPQARADGSDICIVNAAQDRPVAWRIVETKAAGKFTLEIALPDPATVAPHELPLRFYIYHGNPKAEPMTVEGWELPSVAAESLLLAQGQQPETWDEVQFWMERTRRGAERQFVPQISPDVIGFERSRPQLTVYRATLRCPEDGDYAFALDSTGASFLVIDDTRVVANSGNPRWGRLRAGDPVKLTAGLHRAEIYHVCVIPASPVSLGWETPQMRQERPAQARPDFRTVPASALLPAARGRQVSRETAGTPLNPFFTHVQRGAVRVNDTASEFITIQFSDATVGSTRIVSRHWDFGDGRTVTANDPTHVFLGTKPREVTLTVTDASGAKVSAVRTVEFERTVPVAAQVVMELERLPAVVSSDAPLGFSVTVKNLRRREMELKLTSTPLRANGPMDDDADEFRFREKLLKLGADDDFTTEIKCPSPRDKRSSGTMLFGLSLGLRFHNVEVARTVVRFLRPDNSLKSVETDGHLTNESGELVVLVVNPTANRAETAPSFPKRVVCLDDSLCGDGVVMDGGESFAQSLEASLKIPVRHLAWNTDARARKGVPTLYKFTQLDGAPIEKGDWAILSLGLPDLHDRVGADDYEKQVIFIADYLRLMKGANVLLVPPPPLPSNPEASRAYAKKIVQIGLQKNLPVLDLYSLMRVRGDWQDFFRDTTTKGQASSYLYYPNSAGQKWIAEKMARVISKWNK